jgi:hypothetical protein
MKKLVSYFLILCAIISLCACRPSDDDIKAAIVKSLMGSIPISIRHTGYFTCEIQEVQILEVKSGRAPLTGKKCWRVSVYVKGTSWYGKGTPCEPFEGNATYLVERGPFDELFASVWYF